MSQSLIRESHEHEPRERTPESRLARPALIVDDALFAGVTPPRGSSIAEASYGIPVQLGSRALLVAVVVAVSFAAGFGGGFLVGQRSRPSTESIDVSHDESATEPQPARAAEDPKPIASTTQKVAPISEEKDRVQSRSPQQRRRLLQFRTSRHRVRRLPQPWHVNPRYLLRLRRVLVRSTPAGAGVVVDGRRVV